MTAAVITAALFFYNITSFKNAAKESPACPDNTNKFILFWVKYNIYIIHVVLDISKIRGAGISTGIYNIYIIHVVLDISKIRGAGISTSIYNIYMLYKMLPRSVGRVYLLVYIIYTCCIRCYQGPWGGYIY